MPVSLRFVALVAIAAALCGCTQQAEPSAESGEAAAPAPDETEPQASTPSQKWRPTGVTSRREHEGDAPHVTRLTEGVYWVEPSVLTALVSEVAAGALRGRAEADAWHVTNVASGSTAARLGLQPGDSIRRVADHEVGDAEMFAAVHERARHGERIDVELKRDGETEHLRYHVAQTLEPPSSDVAHAQLAAVLGSGVIAYGPSKRVIDRLVLSTIREHNRVISRGDPEALIEIFGLPDGAEIESISSHTVDHPRVAWIALGTLADEKAFTLTYDVDEKAALVEVEVSDGIVSAEDLEAAWTKVEETDRRPRSRDIGSASDEARPSLEGIEKKSEHSYAIERKAVDAWLANPTALARGARVVPSMTDGKTDGFKLYAIRPGSVYAALGIKNGDKVVAVNGMDVSSPDKALEVYGKLRKADKIVLDIVRRGKPLKLTYEID